MATVASMFAGIDAAQASRDSNYFRDGLYWWHIEGVKAGTTRKGVPFLAVECRCVHVFDNGDGKGHKPLEHASWLCMADKDSFLGNVKAFVANVTGAPEEEVTKDVCEALCGDEQPLAGWFVETYNKTIITKVAQKPFTKVAWRRSVSNEEILATVDEGVLAIMFPNGLDAE